MTHLVRPLPATDPYDRLIADIEQWQRDVADYSARVERLCTEVEAFLAEGKEA